MIEQTYDYKISLLQGTYDESGQAQTSTTSVRTRQMISYESSLYNATFELEAVLPLPIDGTTDGDDDIKIPSLAQLNVDTYLNNPNYEVKYYWFTIRRQGYDDGHGGDYWRVGSCVTVIPVIGGNKENESPFLAGYQNAAYSSGYGGAHSTSYIECDVLGNYLKYTSNGITYETTVAQFILGSVLHYDEDTDNYSATLKANRDSEFVDAEAALLGYTSNNTSSLIFNQRWYEPYIETNLVDYIPFSYINVVVRVDENTNITPDYITKAIIKTKNSSWQLLDNNKLYTFPIPEEIDSDLFVSPFPASFWYYDNGLGHLFMMLIPKELRYGEFEGTRPEQINVYDISEPQNGFDHNGLAILMPIECISDKEERGRWDLTLTHPIDDYKKWTYIVGQNVLKVNGQLFRIDETEIYQDADTAYITAHAQHITYDLFGRFVDELTVENASGGSYIDQVIQRSEEILPTHQPEPNEYTFDVSSNIEGPVTAKVQDQTVIGALFGDDNSLASRYGGQLYRDNFHMSINTTQEGAPTAPAFKLRFGTDLTKLSYKIDFSNWITELICVSNLGDLWGVSYTGSEWIIHHQRTRRMHFTYDPDTPDPFECLMRDGFAYWQTVNTPTVSIEVAVAALKNDPKYKDFVDLQNLDVGYTGNVYIEQYGIDINLKIVSIRRDELTGEALQVVLGTSRGSFIRSPVMSQTIVANGTVLGKQEAEMQAMKEQIDDMKIKQMRHWSGTKAYSWAEVKNYTWREIFVGHKN